MRSSLIFIQKFSLTGRESFRMTQATGMLSMAPTLSANAFGRPGTSFGTYWMGAVDTTAS
ncbi:hypothetical protein D3C73_1565810 [compost metagenome]